MKVEILTRNAIEDFIKKEFKKRDSFNFKQIDVLRRRIITLEESIKILRQEKFKFKSNIPNKKGGKK